MDAHPEISFCFHAAKVENLDATFSPNLIRPYIGDSVISAQEVINKRAHYPTASLLLRTEYMKVCQSIILTVRWEIYPCR